MEFVVICISFTLFMVLIIGFSACELVNENNEIELVDIKNNLKEIRINQYHNNEYDE